MPRQPRADLGIESYEDICIASAFILSVVYATASRCNRRNLPGQRPHWRYPHVYGIMCMHPLLNTTVIGFTASQYQWPCIARHSIALHGIAKAACCIALHWKLRVHTLGWGRAHHLHANAYTPIHGITIA